MAVKQEAQGLLSLLLTCIAKCATGKQVDILSAFAKQYYAHAFEDDITARPVDHLYGAFLSHWETGLVRHPGELKIRAYNPTEDVEGWDSDYTVIEIVHDDMPFLVDTMSMACTRLGLSIHFFINCGNTRIVRSNTYRAVSVLAPDDPLPASGNVSTDAFLYFEIDRQPDDQIVLGELVNKLKEALSDVRAMVDDFPDMKGLLSGTIEMMRSNPGRVAKRRNDEAIAFFEWLLDNHFIFVATMDYRLRTRKGKQVFEPVKDSRLGILRNEQRHNISRFFGDESLESEVETGMPWMIAQSDYKSPVHRDAELVDIRHRLYSPRTGRVCGERRFLGLYTSVCYHGNPLSIPIIRKKVRYVMDNSGLSPLGHSGKALVNVLETYPRDELFQISEQDLFNTAMGILRIQERNVIKLFCRKDTFGRYFHCMVYVPRDIYQTELRQKFGHILMQALGGVDYSFEPTFLETGLCRIDFSVIVDPDLVPDIVVLKNIEEKLIVAARNWPDDLRMALVEAHGSRQGLLLASRYEHAFPAGYRESFLAKSAAMDVDYIERLSDENPLEMSFYRVLEEEDGRVHFKIFYLHEAMALTDVLPILENLGLRVIDERPYCITLPNDQRVWISDFGMQAEGNHNALAEDDTALFEEAFLRIWRNEAEDDGFNRLVLVAGLCWREVMLMRAYAKYLFQIGFHYSDKYVQDTLVEHADITRALVRWFSFRFSPKYASTGEKELVTIEARLEKLFDRVTSLEKDCILRRYLALMKATLRTNFYQKDDQCSPKCYVSFKFSPVAIPDIPRPVPQFEIYVYSPDMEGVHLRGARVARGGLRWSDRQEDYRTEVLGLMKAQQVKNAVIVPLGAKGGFVAKRAARLTSREAYLAEGIRCYKIFISGLLDLTDNVAAGKVTLPLDVVCYDEVDPYLVVAADKGTATFSDIANELASSRGFWMGDAFASGGSNGYDHKKMGITARGAWESVRRHFLSLGHDTQREAFTVVGIGDMAGDVFGNGMLLSKHIRLVAAFNHKHIFIDPSPDAAVSFKERQRLFKLPRSSWADYNPKLISKGGGVFERSAKTIKLSAAIRKHFGIEETEVEPNVLIRYLLLAEEDLLWNGGIGTYVKASTQTHADVGDPTNDCLRVNGEDLRFRVVGEGGNLGFTQLGRVEFARAGGRIYTDAIDNSAGVNCSDHEVNIKILLNDAMEAGSLSESQRNKLLAQMESDVADLVLDNNYHQAQSIDLFCSTQRHMRYVEMRLLHELEREGHLDRALEFLPDDKALAARYAIGERLTAPEIAVLMAYVKTVIKHALLRDGLTEDKYFRVYLAKEFPAVLGKRYASLMAQHQLSHDIVVTTVTNEMVQYGGFDFMHRLYDETGARPVLVIQAYFAALSLFDIPAYWAKIEAMDTQVPVSIQLQMMRVLRGLLRRVTRWILHESHADPKVIAKLGRVLKPDLDNIAQHITGILYKSDKQLRAQLVNAFKSEGAPADLANFLGTASFISGMLDVVRAAHLNKLDAEELAKVYFMLNERLSFAWIRRSLIRSHYKNYWQILSSTAMRDDLVKIQRILSVNILRSTSEKSSLKARIDAWLETHQYMVSRWDNMLADLKENEDDFVIYQVAVHNLMDLAQASEVGL